MVLQGVSLMGHTQPVNIHIQGSQITGVSTKEISEPNLTQRLTFENALAFPGLINSHDHLDFNLFPQLGNMFYSNYVKWGQYIHQHYKSEIDAVLKVPLALRVQWGVYKNLLCGVTTVLNHGPDFYLYDALISVYQKCQNLHSTQLEKYWKLRLNNPLKIAHQAVIHIGEGVDEQSANGIDQLIKWNVLKRNLIGVHAVAMTGLQAKKFKALVWCPYSNYFLLGKTAAINQLKKSTDILFGSDSTLSADWNIWNHISLARKTNMLSDVELQQSLTETAAKVWQLNTGKIEQGKDADMVIIKPKDEANALNSFLQVSPKDILLIMHRGNIRLFDACLLDQLHTLNLTSYSRIYMGDACKYVQGDLPGLIHAIHSYYPDAQFPVKFE